jgi:hypothetical protein
VKLLRLGLALLVAPLVTGAVVVTYQDASLTHWPGRAVTQAQLREGTFSFLHPGASCGQPLAGNPNFGVFFPDTLLLPFLPLSVAFGLRFALPLVLGYVGARRWARAEGAPREAAELAAVSFVLSGVFLSTWRFYNSGLTLSLAPWVLAAVVRVVERASSGYRPGARRSAAELGIAAGLEVLAGEPVIALLTAVVAAARVLAARAGKARAIVPLAGAIAIALLVAAPQIAATAQILPDSSRVRNPFPFVVATGTSTHPLRLVEQVVPFPYGRPDLFGALGFDGHEVFDHHTPYLWTLHLGLPVLGLLVLFACPLAAGRRERVEAVATVLAIGAGLLAFGRYLPGARELYPLLSLDGRIRLPVKWWTVVALALVPLVGRAATRWSAGARPSETRRVLGWSLAVASGLVLAWQWPATGLAAAGPVLSLLVLVLLLADRGARRLDVAAGALAAVLLLSHAPLLLALLDRPPAAPPRVTTGRIVARLTIDPHPVGGATFVPGTVRDFYRRGPAELWPLLASVAGAGYAFDEDPDGAYSDDDRVLRKLLDDRPWPDRASELRLAGVTHVVTDEPLPRPFREASVLNEREGVRLYALDGALPSVRFATRVVRRPSPEALLEAHGSEGFDPETDVVLEGRGEDTGERVRVRPVQVRQSADLLVAQVDAPVPGVLVWSRTFFGAWWAAVDGRPTDVVRADGHLVGVRVPEGHHEVTIGWRRGPVATGALLAVAGLALAARAARPSRASAPGAPFAGALRT